MRFIVLFIIGTFVLYAFSLALLLCCRPSNHYVHYGHTETFHSNIQWLSTKPQITFHEKSFFLHGVFFTLFFLFALVYNNRNMIRFGPWIFYISLHALKRAEVQLHGKRHAIILTFFNDSHFDRTHSNKCAVIYLLLTCYYFNDMHWILLEQW